MPDPQLSGFGWEASALPALSGFGWEASALPALSGFGWEASEAALILGDTALNTGIAFDAGGTPLGDVQLNEAIDSGADADLGDTPLNQNV